MEAKKLIEEKENGEFKYTVILSDGTKEVVDKKTFDAYWFKWLKLKDHLKTKWQHKDTSIFIFDEVEWEENYRIRSMFKATLETRIKVYQDIIKSKKTSFTRKPYQNTLTELCEIYEQFKVIENGTE